MRRGDCGQMDSGRGRKEGDCRGGGRRKGNLTKGMCGGGEEGILWVNGCVGGGGGRKGTV